MSRRFKTADYAATLNQTISISEALPADHLARFVVDVVAQLDLQAIYARYKAQGGEAYAPEVLVALLFYGYATGVFSSRKIEKATYEVLPFRYVAGDLHPDHGTVAWNFGFPNPAQVFANSQVSVTMTEVDNNNTPFLGNAKMQVFNVVPQQDGTITVRYNVDWDSNLRILFNFIIVN
jgi:hypothetical protein